MPSVAQQSHSAVAGRRGCNNRADMTNVWRRGKHEATALDPNNVHPSRRSAVAVRERAIANESADPLICYKLLGTYKTSPALGPCQTFPPAPTMPSSSRRFAPYPPSKPTAAPHSHRPHPTPLSVSATNQPYWSGAGSTHTTRLESQYAYPTHWEASPLELQPSWFGLSAQSGSPCSDDSAVTTPVSAVSQLPPQPLIRGIDYGVPGTGEHGLFAFPTFDFFQSNNGPMAVPASYSESIANIAQSKLANDYHQTHLEPLADSYSFHHQTPAATEAKRDCSFAKTSPQFISPFSDSAVTSRPQLLPLYAPKPVRPIPKVCFTPPEDDPLPPHSLLYQPVSKAVRETRFRPQPKPL